MVAPRLPTGRRGAELAGRQRRRQALSGFLEILGRGLDVDLTDLLDRYFWSPQAGDVQQMQADPEGGGEQGELHVRLGVGELRASQLDEAVAHLSRACRQKPDDAGVRVALASACDQQGRLAEALEHLTAADRLRPGEVPILFAMGFCRERLGEPQAAAAHYRQAVAAGPSFASVRQRLAAVDLVLDRLDEAVEQYQDLRQGYPEDTWYRAALAHLYFRVGKFFQAAEEFQSAIAMEPENWALVDDEAEALAAERKAEKGVRNLFLLPCWPWDPCSGRVGGPEKVLADPTITKKVPDPFFSHHGRGVKARPVSRVPLSRVKPQHTNPGVVRYRRSPPATRTGPLTIRRTWIG
jgi:Flp pilus assembly protein TadD